MSRHHTKSPLLSRGSGLDSDLKAYLINGTGLLGNIVQASVCYQQNPCRNLRGGPRLFTCRARREQARRLECGAYPVGPKPFPFLSNKYGVAIFHERVSVTDLVPVNEGAPLCT